VAVLRIQAFRRPRTTDGRWDGAADQGRIGGVMQLSSLTLSCTAQGSHPLEGAGPIAPDLRRERYRTLSHRRLAWGRCRWWNLYGLSLSGIRGKSSHSPDKL